LKLRLEPAVEVSHDPPAMKALHVVLPILLLASPLGLLLPALPAAAADESPSSLFNGRDLSGWKAPASNVIWRVADGMLIGQSDEKRSGSMLYTERSYSNFVFETEVRWQGDCDSGVMFRKPELQLQLGVSRSLKTEMTCCFYTGGKDLYPQAGRAKELEKHLKPGDWNRIRLEVIGATYTVWLNGVQVTQFTEPKYANPGPIGLQVHAGVTMRVEFRNLRVKELP
jgi:hypothetical protein